MSRYPRALAVAVVAGMLSSVAVPDLAAQQPTYNYFARTPESDKVLQSNETHHLGKGVASLRSGRPNDLVNAKAEFDFILNYWPNHPQVLGLQATTLARMGRVDLIDGYFERAYEMSPNVGQLYVVHGVALLQQGKVNEAIKRLQRGAELDPESMNAHYNLGLALVRAKRLKEANLHAQRAYALGHPLPGLRDQLTRAKAWNPDAAPVTKSEAPKSND